MEPLEETDPPRRVDPNGGNSNCHARPDEEPQSFLENLDMSEFGGFDFDFSCLQETSQSIVAFTLDGQDVRMIDAFDQTVPMTEQSTYDFNIAPTLDDSDPLALANSDDDWLIQFVELNHQVPSALESVDNSFGLCLSGPPLQSQGDQSQQQAIQWDGNFLNDHSIQHTTLRVFELSLFEVLQRATRSISGSIEEQIEFIHSVLFILILEHSSKNDIVNRLEAQGRMSNDEIADILDRQRPVRTALWIYASICIDKLPSGIDLWSHLPEELKYFKGTPQQNLNQSLENYDSSLTTSLNSWRAQQKHDLHRLFPFSKEFSSTEKQEHTQRISNWTAYCRGKRRMTERVKADAGFEISVGSHIDEEVRDILNPRGPTDFCATARIFHEMLISIANAPKPGSVSPFACNDGIGLSYASHGIWY
ncbi:hypothetical protein RAB80_014605 [Fusarium oxysporum f. sp. vasinfectum]|nr:hypothetical protein RAB80_014605 [Fusarium oxysporum f. sp. vasinfectum]